MDQPYTGRFAPSPTGRLHSGSVLAALGSWLDARHHGGRWLLRMEDIDATRVVPGAADDILRTLELLGLAWDGPVEHQQPQQEHYRAALDRLRAAGLTFECSCSRRELAHLGETGYPGTCRAGPVRPGPTATRFCIGSGPLQFEDRIQGCCRFRLEELGDVVIRRRDGLFAYQLAVVVDDARQGITHVVRGVDLLASTPWQILLQQALELPRPAYAHLPVVVGADGGKLAKSRHAVTPHLRHPGEVLLRTLRLLRQDPPGELAGCQPPELLSWAIAHWNPGALRGLGSVVESAAFS